MKKLVLALSVIAFTACNNNQQKDKTTQESNQPVIEETVAPAPARIPSRGSTI